VETVTGYAVASDGAYIAYQTLGDGPTDLAWQFDWFGNIDALWDVDLQREWLSGLAGFSRVYRGMRVDRRQAWRRERYDRRTHSGARQAITGAGLTDRERPRGRQRIHISRCRRASPQGAAWPVASPPGNPPT